MKNPRLYRRDGPAPILYIKDYYARRRLKADRDFWKCLKPVFSGTISMGCDFYELWTLYRYVLKAKPRSILELGSGVSTVVMAYAISRIRDEGYRCKFVSMEESEKFHAQLKSIFPKELAGLVEHILSPTEDRRLGNGLVARCYTQKPRHAYDFVFIDGPQYPNENNYFDGDLLDAVAWNDKPIVAFLDQRLSTRTILKRLLPFAKCKETTGFAKFFVPAVAARKPVSGYDTEPRQPAATQGGASS